MGSFEPVINGSINRLAKIIEEFNVQSKKLTIWLIVLTFVIAVETLLLLVGLGTQIWLVLK